MLSRTASLKPDSPTVYWVAVPRHGRRPHAASCSVSQRDDRPFGESYDLTHIVRVSGFDFIFKQLSPCSPPLPRPPDRPIAPRLEAAPQSFTKLDSKPIFISHRSSSISRPVFFVFHHQMKKKKEIVKNCLKQSNYVYFSLVFFFRFRIELQRYFSSDEVRFLLLSLFKV